MHCLFLFCFKKSCFLHFLLVTMLTKGAFQQLELPAKLVIQYENTLFKRKPINSMHIIGIN